MGGAKAEGSALLPAGADAGFVPMLAGTDKRLRANVGQGKQIKKIFLRELRLSFFCPERKSEGLPGLRWAYSLEIGFFCANDLKEELFEKARQKCPENIAFSAFSGHIILKLAFCEEPLKKANFSYSFFLNCQNI